MITFTDPDMVLTSSPYEREEMFPMQEQDQGPVTVRTERPAAEIYIERLADLQAGIPAPVLIP